MNYLPEILTSSGVVAGVVAAWRFVKTPVGLKVLSRFSIRSVGQTCEEVRAALETLSQVVEAQGRALEWLSSELDKARNELMAETNKSEAENVQLRKRVAELEVQVKILEKLLAAKKVVKKTTVKRRIK